MQEITAKRFDLFFDAHIGIGIRWDNWLFPIHLSISFPFVTFTIGLGRRNLSGEVMPSITDQACECPSCHWSGTVWDCEGDIDGDGSLGCPVCFEAVKELRGKP